LCCGEAEEKTTKKDGENVARREEAGFLEALRTWLRNFLTKP